MLEINRMHSYIISFKPFSFYMNVFLTEDVRHATKLLGKKIRCFLWIIAKLKTKID